jgi:hypothetical protein
MTSATWLLLGAALVGGLPVVAWAVPGWPAGVRCAAGLVVGLVVQGLATLACAHRFGVQPTALSAGVAVALLPGLVTLRHARELGPWSWSQPARHARLGLGLFVVGTLLLWPVAQRGIVRLEGGGWGTGAGHNLGDLPFHLAVIAGFTHGNNLPPQHPELAGAPLSYPYLIDWLAAVPVVLGDDLPGVLHVHTAVLSMTLLVLLAYWGFAFTGHRAVACLVPPLVLLDGGLGFIDFFAELGQRPARLALLDLGRDFTIGDEAGLRWGNALTTLLLPQRAWLVGLPLLLATITLAWQALGAGPDTRARRRLWCAAGVCAGLIPLAHAHAFVLACGLLLACAGLFGTRGALLALGVALALGGPQLALLMRHTQVQAGSFLAWHWGWDRGDQDPFSFWLWNTGVLLPLLGFALFWREPRLLTSEQRRFYAPLGALFVLANLLRLSPWIWDNVKVLFPWYVASTPLVASALVLFARQGWPGRVLAGLLFGLLTCAGALDVWRVGSRQIELALFDEQALDFARAVGQATTAQARLAHAPRHDAPTLLSGRPAVLGYPGHIWSQGLDAGRREADLMSVYTGGADPTSLTSAYGATHIVTGPQERSAYGELPDALRVLPVVVRVGPFELRRLAAGTAPPPATR